MRAINLRTEYLINPLGLDIIQPRFYWQCADGVIQTAYQIVAEREGKMIWDSGIVSSSQMTHIRYAGQPLRSRDAIEWRVKLWDENGLGGEWSAAHFEMGLLEKSDWQAQWISGDYKPRKNKRYPIDCFQKSFRVSKDVAKARLYVTACGLYEARLNGQKIGDFCLAPGCTDYRKRVQYQTYDVTSLLKAENKLEIQLADGWYRGSVGAFGKTNVYGRRTQLLCQLELVGQDGSRETIVSDGTFAWSNDGPIRFADLKDGEIYHAGLTPSYCGQARVVASRIIPAAANNVRVIEKERFAARLLTTPSGRRVLDFGQNIAGFLAFSVRGQPGQKIKLRCGEILDQQGELTQKNFQLKKPVKEINKLQEVLLMMEKTDKIRGELVPTPRQEIELTCSGKLDNYKTTFAVFGFRYAEIETDIAFDAADFAAVAVYSDLEPTGQFSCSNPDINRFYENTVWSMKGNFLDIPTDCPTRERLGWTGDAQVFFNTAASLMNVAPFFRKWLLDLADSQLKSGKLPAVAPYVGFEMMYNSAGGSVGWNDAAVLIPYRFWKRYGDESILRDFYPMMSRVARYMIKNSGACSQATQADNPYRKYTYEKGIHLGEWLEPNEFQDPMRETKSCHPEECTAYLHYTMTCLAEIADTLGHSTDAQLYREYADGARQAYNRLFVKDGTIDTDRQAKLVRPLALGLLTGEVKRRVQDRLVQAVQNRQYKIGTGFLSTPFVLPVLTEAGRADIAYQMLENTAAPSWLAEVKAGATTVWEDWEGQASHNHYSPGAVCEWLFTTVGGIRVAGENRFEIRPVPGDSLSFAEASYDSLYGRVSCRWEKIGSGWRFVIFIPPNTRANILLPDDANHDVGCGQHEFTLA